MLRCQVLDMCVGIGAADIGMVGIACVGMCVGEKDACMHESR